MSIAQQLHEAILQEIKAQKRSRRSIWLLIDKTEVLDEKPGHFIYRLSLSEDIRIAADSALVIKVPGQDGTFEVQVLFTADQTLVVMSQQPLPQHMALVRVEFDPTFILKRLDEHLDQVLRFPPKPLAEVMSKAIGTIRRDAVPPDVQHVGMGVNALQRDAISRMLADSVHLLWGPPGTGKTHTLGVAVSEHIRLGKTCLLLSTSNAAVDEMVRATARALGDEARSRVFRFGATPDSEVQAFTSMGLLTRREPRLAEEAKRAEVRLRRLTLGLSCDLNARGAVFDEVQRCRETINSFAARSKSLTDSALSEAQCVAATMAALVLNPTLSEREFDVVYMDEASMVSLPFSFAGAAQATEQVVFAGDFRQLPPICHSDLPEVREWFGRNIFDYLGISARRSLSSLPPFVSMLREQYRMTERIAEVVSDLSYGGKLITNEGIGVGTRPVFIDVSQFCPTSHYSVQESSYYQPHSLLFLNAICKTFREWLGPETLLLSPFRAQRSLLDAASKDLSSPQRQFSASTIHKAQGSQEHTVVVDLTAHSSDNPQKFFTGEDAENLINVALSRAQQHLVIFGSAKLVETLASGNEYWRRFWEKLRKSYVQVPARDVIAELPRYDNLFEAWGETSADFKYKALPSIFVESGSESCPADVRQRFAESKLGTKLVISVAGRLMPAANNDGITYRESRSGSIPRFATWQGYLTLPLMQQWGVLRMPLTSKRLASIACGHLFEAQFELSDTHRLLCPKCSHRLLLRSSFDTSYLKCSKQFCGYSRPMSPQDANTLIEVQGLTCPECGARPQPRRSRLGESIFLGCSNYPRCEGKVRWRDYADEIIR